MKRPPSWLGISSEAHGRPRDDHREHYNALILGATMATLSQRNDRHD